jgi:putative two-component system response regulator
MNARSALNGGLRVVADQAVRRLAALAASVDGGAEHSRRVGEAAESVARRMGLDERFVALIREAAPLHDVGKLEIPRAILEKPGPLTMRERVTMQRHAAAGEELCRSSGSDPILRLAAQIARSHHERWDGRGYPDGRAFDGIPLAARIVAVVDVFDALISERPYKGAWSVAKALQHLAENAGSQFDPDVVAALISLVEHGELCAN